MFTLMQNIVELFPALNKELYSGDAACYISGWKRAEREEPDCATHRLYLCGESDSCSAKNQLRLVKNLKKAKRSSEENNTPDKGQNILLLETVDFDLVEETLRSHFEQQLETSVFANLLFDLQFVGSDLQTVTDNVYPFFENPIYVFDENFNLLAANWDVIKDREQLIPFHGSNPLSEDWMFEMLDRNNHIHKRVMKSELPILSDNQYLGIDQLYCAIDTKKNRGHITVSAVNKPFSERDFEYILLLKKFIRLQMRNAVPAHETQGDNIEYFLRDILTKRITGRAFLPPTLEHAVKSFSGNLSVLVIETERSEAYVNELRIRSAVTNVFSDAVILSYNGQMVTVLKHGAGIGLAEEEKEALSEIFSKEGLYAGLSLCFGDIFALPDYYEQALRSIELGAESRNEPGLFTYEAYYMGHLKHIFMQHASADVFCHPKMQVLLSYDQQNRTKLAYTYYMYLKNGRNYVITGKAMDLHRTTIAYRLKKIGELIGEETEDASEILHMILSYEMLNSASSVH